MNKKKYLRKRKSKLSENIDFGTVIEDEHKENYCDDVNLRKLATSNAYNNTALSSLSMNSLIKPFRSLLNFKHKSPRQVNTDKKLNLSGNVNFLRLSDDENQENCQLALIPKTPERVETAIGEGSLMFAKISSTKLYRSLLQFKNKNQRRVRIDKNKSSCENMRSGNQENYHFDVNPKPTEIKKVVIGEALSTLPTINTKPFRSLLNFKNKDRRDISMDETEKLCDSMELGILSEEDEEDSQLYVIPKPPEIEEDTIGEALSTLPTTSTKPFRSLVNFKNKDKRDVSMDEAEKLCDSMELEILSEKGEEDSQLYLMPKPPEIEEAAIGEELFTLSTTSTKPFGSLVNFKNKDKKEVSMDDTENLCDNMELYILKEERNKKNYQLDLIPKALEEVETTIGEVRPTIPPTSTNSFKNLLNFMTAMFLLIVIIKMSIVG